MASATNQTIIDETDQCVMCGLCLPHCPTYSVAKNEAESPRGRISLIRALHEGKLQPNKTLTNHIDNCLTCLSCEMVCPANINYKVILDAGRSITNEQHSILYQYKQSLLLFVLTTVRARGLIKKVIKIYHYLGIRKILNGLFVKFPYVFRVFNLIPNLQPINFTSLPAKDTAKDTRIVLVDSCAGDLFSSATKESAKILLQALHCEIVETKQFDCCGALHQHNGQLGKAQQLMQKFSESIINENFDTLISLATGCAAQLNRYPELLGYTAATKRIAKHVDINTFALQQLEKHKLQFKPLPKTVFIHTPCTQNFNNGNAHVIEKLLNEIPEIRICIFHDELACCGAGGMNSFTQAKLADRLIANKMDELASSDATYLVTSNIGCALHFQAQIRNDNKPIMVCHPVTLLVQQLLYSDNA